MLCKKVHPHIKDTTDFHDKIKNLYVLKDAFLATADVADPYPNIPLKAGLQLVISTEDLVKLEEFVIISNYSEFARSIYQHVSAIAIDTKFAPPYASTFMDRLEASFLET